MIENNEIATVIQLGYNISIASKNGWILQVVNKFIEFLLEAIYDTLCELAETDQVMEQVTEQVNKLLEVIGDKEFSTRELMGLLRLKHRPTFRDNYLLPALELGYIIMTIPDKPNSSKQKYIKVKNAIMR